MKEKETVVRELANGQIVPEIAGKEVEVIQSNGQFVCTSKDRPCIPKDK